MVKNDAVVRTGCNGLAHGVINCLEAGCLKDKLNIPSYQEYHCLGIHAEENAVINAARHRVSVSGGKLYLYGQRYDTGETLGGRPCDRCKCTLINAGIEEAITKNEEGTIIKNGAKDWVSKDAKEYLKRLVDAGNKLILKK